MRTSQLESRTHTHFPLRFDSFRAFRATNDLFARGSLDFFLDTVQTHLRTHGQQLNPTQPVESLVPGEDREKWDKQVRTIPQWCADMASYLYRYRPVCAFDTFSHPTALLLVVSGSNPDPMNAFAQLYDESCSSDVFQSQPHLEKEVLRSYLVVHDAADPNADWKRSEALLVEVQKTYGLQCAVLSINSAKESVPAICQRLHLEWDTPDLRAPPSAPCDTCALDENDVTRIEAYIREFVVKSLVPYLERSVQQLNEQVGSSRRGLTGRLLGAGRKWFGTRTPSDSTPTSGWDRERSVYPASSLSAQTRRLADLAFYLCDYRLAAEMYDTLRRDYEQDRATSYMAAATEMLCLTRLLGKSTDPQIPALFSSACDEYLQDPAGRLYALRTTFLYSDVQWTLEHGAEVAAAFLRAARFTDEVLRGVVLELAALAYLCMPHPYVRKSAVTMLQSAEQFDSCGQKAFALRCYLLAAPYYEHQRWPAILDHVLMKLVRQAQNSGKGEEALAHLVKLLYTTSRGEEQDRKLLERLLDVYKFATHAEPIVLPSPVCDVSQSSFACAHSPEWDAMLTEHGLQHLRSHGVQSTGANEPITLLLYLQNPLHTKINVSKLMLELEDDKSALVDAGAVSVEAPAASLAPRESRTVHVSVRITQLGTFRVRAVRFLLEDCVPVYQEMQKKGARLNATKAQRLTRTYAPDTTLQVQIREALPCLDAVVHEAPMSAHVGELLALPVVLQNQGATALTLVNVLCTPVHCQPRSDDTAIGHGEQLVAAQMSLSSAHAQSTELAPGQQVTLPWTLPLLTPGPTRVQWLFVYQNVHGSQFSSYAQHTIEVRPLLYGSISYKPATASTYLALFTLENQSDECVTVDGLSMLSTQWRGTAHAQALQLAPGEQSTVAVRIERAATPVDATLPNALSAIAPLFGESRPTPELAPLRFYASHLQGSGAKMPLATFIASHAAMRAQWVDEVYAFLPLSVRRRAFLLAESNEVDLLAAWSLPDGTRGCTLMYGAQVGLRTDAPADIAALSDLARVPRTMRAMYAETAREKERIAQQLLASPLARMPEPIGVEVDVRRAASPLDAADPLQLQAKPVPLRIRNESTWTLDYTLRLLPASARAAPTQPIAPWIGSTVLRGTLAPWSTTLVHAAVAAAAPGAYQLGDWACEATLAETGLSFTVDGWVTTALVVGA